MKRCALIIVNPGNAGQKSYCKGVFKDALNYDSFLKSPNGGYWKNDEIHTLDRKDASTVRDAIKFLQSVDYSFIAFCGHGGHSSASASVTVEIKPGVSISSDELRKGAKRHTLVLDCCRGIEKPRVLLEAALERAYKSESLISPDKCRKFYETRIQECGEGIIVAHGCALGEQAGDDEELGGFYSYSLIDAAKKWIDTTVVDTKTNCCILSVPEAHDKALTGVDRMSADRQHPKISKPRSETHFPFAIIA
ncbi:MAG: caspase family protein [Rhodospirillaceae bacterium]|nr:caspase family protein [Rhodospirillaceae bacterium]